MCETHPFWQSKLSTNKQGWDLPAPEGETLALDKAAAYPARSRSKPSPA